MLDESFQYQRQAMNVNYIEFLRGKRILAVSPHPDDVALSCGGFLRLLSNVELTVLTCFSRSLYAPFVNAAALSIDAVREIRVTEDKNYAQFLGAEYVDLGLDDVSVRFSDSDDWICEQPDADAAYMASVENIAEAVSSDYTHILCPLAVGYNVDHLITFEAVRRGASANQQILYYEDLPYGIRIGGPKFVSDYASAIISGGKALTIDITSVLDAKMSGIGIYKSQIYPEDAAGVILYAAGISESNGYAERLWSVPAAAQ